MKEKSFTLIELIVVISIIAILAAVVAPNAFNAIEKAKIASFIREINAIKKAAIGYYSDTGDWGVEMVESPDGQPMGSIPNDDIFWDQTFFLVDNRLPGWDGPYLNKIITNNPWGGAYAYFSGILDIFSAPNDFAGERGICTIIGNINTEGKIDSIIDDSDLSKGLFRRNALISYYFGVHGNKPPMFFLVSRDGPVD